VWAGRREASSDELRDPAEAVFVSQMGAHQVVKWDSRSERDWRIFLNSEVALTVLVEDGSFLDTPRSVMMVFWNKQTSL
jgi:hypothetical protein